MAFHDISWAMFYYQKTCPPFENGHCAPPRLGRAGCTDILGFPAWRRPGPGQWPAFSIQQRRPAGLVTIEEVAARRPPPPGASDRRRLLAAGRCRRRRRRRPEATQGCARWTAAAARSLSWSACLLACLPACLFSGTARSRRQTS